MDMGKQAINSQMDRCCISHFAGDDDDDDLYGDVHDDDNS